MNTASVTLDALLAAHQEQLETASPLPVGVAERYIPLSLLRDGAARKVYRVRDRLSGEEYILKIAAGVNGALLWQEYALLKTLKYPCFPRPVQCFELGGAVCLLREFIPGQTLEAFAQARAVTPREACKLALQLCDIAAILHAQNPPYIHRDLTPRNLILAPDGRLVLIDLDSARPYGTDKPADTVALGTLGAAAPEQYGARQSDARTDVFGIGMLITYLLIGEYAPEKLTRREHGGNLVKVIQKATAFDPAARFPSVAALKRGIQDAAQPGRKWAVWAGAGAVTLAAAVLLFLWLPGALALPSAPARFESQLIGKAAAHSLGMDGGTVTNADLQSVTDILLLQNDVFDRWDDLRTYGMRNVHLQNRGFEIKTGTGAVTTLADIARMPNLTSLALVDHRISDITPLKGMQLTHLSLVDCPVRDISALKNMLTLEKLDLNGTMVEDLDALRNLPNLWEISIVESQVHGLWQLESLPSLTHLKIGGENCYYDYSSLGRLTRLNQLWITRPMPELLPEINRLTNLGGLFFCPYPGKDLTPISNLTGLYSLGLMGPALESFEGIEVFENLHEMYLTLDQKLDFSPLETLPNLRYIDITQSHIDDLSFVAKLSHLESLYVRRDQVELLPTLPEGFDLRVQE